jgi:hypothetical protein
MNIPNAAVSLTQPQALRARRAASPWLFVGMGLATFGGVLVLGLLQSGNARTTQAAQAAPQPAACSTAPDTSVPDAATVLQNASDEAPAQQAF